MFNKVYEKIKDIIKNNYKFFILLIVSFVVLTFPLPYYIDAPGGLIDVSERITVEGQKEISGSFNLAYVSEWKATIPTYLWSLLNKNWDVLKKEEVVASNENEKEIECRNHLMLKEANQNATYVGFSLANKYVEITSTKTYVVFIDELAKTNLKIGDQIVKINNVEVATKSDINKLLSQYKVNDKVSITVLRDGVESSKEATLIDYQGKSIIGLVLSEIKDIDTNENVTFNFKPSESGPSGGFMMALSIYNYLIDEDLTHGLTIVGTGTIDEQGNVGEIGGIEYKIKGAVKEKADIFFAPAGENYDEALKIVQKNNYDIKLIKVMNIKEAIAYLQEL